MSPRPASPRPVAGPAAAARVAAAALAATALAACGPGRAGPAGAGGGATPAGPRTPAAAAATPAALVARPLQVPPALAAAPLDVARQVLTPAGWSVTVVARVPGARLAAFTPQGGLLVSRPGAGRVVAVDTATGAVTTVLDGLNQPHGLAFDGTTLYVAEGDRVDAYTWSAGAATGRRTVLAGLPDARSPELHGAYAHALKSVAVGPDHALYVSVGSTGNTSAADRDADPQRATVLRVPPGGGAATVYARGVRNGTGLAVDGTGAVWTAVNNRDNIAYPFDRDIDGDGRSDRGAVVQAYVNDHPMEELARLSAGRDLGWPYCNPDPDVSPGDPASALDYSAPPFDRDEQTNADGSHLDCAALPRIEQGMGAHSAPLGLAFVPAGSSLPAAYRRGALVGVHGSWNRHPPRAPEVSFFPWTGSTLGGQQTLVGGFQAADGSRWGRPVAAVPGPDGSVYVTDDAAGAVYRVTPPPGGTS